MIYNFWWFNGSKKLFFTTKLLIKRKRQKIKKIPQTVLEKIISQIKQIRQWRFNNLFNSLIVWFMLKISIKAYPIGKKKSAKKKFGKNY